MGTDSPASEETGRPTRTRRRLLRVGGAVGVALLSGCTADVGEQLPPNRKQPTSELTPELPVRERTTLLEERIEAFDGATIEDEDGFAAAFDDDALEVESVERSQEVLTIEYVNTESYAEGDLHDVGAIAGAFAALLESRYDAVALGITILDDAPSAFGAAEIDADWARRYNEGDLSAAEYGELVAGTVETARQPPEVNASPGE
ncbi:hypothetical protein GWG54_02705 [Natronococcus sp. JC468]|uniref:hypothetical protein n=1 Tax=Natronococcus sp. JC468 TaxID=1961921 RepID=UPI00143BC445|nr:hypothetical protein [Natronococcus sp. JC468]NKE34740.1 hypothetical protein [Natronococcus sp. JC468]